MSLLRGEGIYLYHSGDFGMPDSGGVCALTPGFSCTGDLMISFLQPVTDLTFNGYFAAPADSVLVSVFGGGGLLAREQVWGNATGILAFDFSSLGRIDRLTIEDRSNPLTQGVAFGNFRYNLWEPPVKPSSGPSTPPPSPPPSVVPLPGSGPLALAAIALWLTFAAGLRRRPGVAPCRA